MVFVKVSGFFSPASFAFSVSRLQQPIRKMIAWFSLLTFILLVAGISAAADGVVYKVRLENGVDQYFRLEVSPGIRGGVEEKMKWGGAGKRP